MGIKVMMHMPYTEHRDFVAESTDFVNLPHDCGDRSTCIMSDTEKEYVFISRRKRGLKRKDLYQNLPIEAKQIA